MVVFGDIVGHVVQLLFSWCDSLSKAMLWRWIDHSLGLRRVTAHIVMLVMRRPERRLGVGVGRRQMGQLVRHHGALDMVGVVDVVAVLSRIVVRGVVMVELVVWLVLGILVGEDRPHGQKGGGVLLGVGWLVLVRTQVGYGLLLASTTDGFSLVTAGLSLTAHRARHGHSEALGVARVAHGRRGVFREVKSKRLECHQNLARPFVMENPVGRGLLATLTAVRRFSELHSI